MRYIQIPIPDAVILTDPEGNAIPHPQSTKDKPLAPEPALFKTFLLQRILDPVFSLDEQGKAKDGGDAVFALIDARTAVLNAKDGMIVLEDETYRCLLHAVNKPTASNDFKSGYNMYVAHNFGGFIAAVREAKSALPAVP